ncbi:hypothetical protein EIN_080020 [Entamoeba invadens IP1]|uniref:hypothetical protein n=1 Tax=Entamoeba invadens IP1 TaxID=370355 RepID=UPI0002C3D78F|nr:hypothetical protein EIN_080020 [Entamoeba invadens IP1]ELP85050.1 hypothetical protein EIN_080020 [Entamoeba invadens IP1]|eukprot:XP_004184396.1 hypothetical protein EIN_080020 [Entamoeba invadens IP1]
MSLSAFTPVMTKGFFLVVEGSNEVPISRHKYMHTVTRQSSPSQATKNDFSSPCKRRKWAFELKKRAVKLARKMGVNNAIEYLLMVDKNYLGLSPSTLQYWLLQAEGTKKEFYN